MLFPLASACWESLDGPSVLTPDYDYTISERLGLGPSAITRKILVHLLAVREECMNISGQCSLTSMPPVIGPDSVTKLRTDPCEEYGDPVDLDLSMLPHQDVLLFLKKLLLYVE